MKVLWTCSCWGGGTAAPPGPPPQWNRHQKTHRPEQPRQVQRTALSPVPLWRRHPAPGQTSYSPTRLWQGTGRAYCIQAFAGSVQEGRKPQPCSGWGEGLRGLMAAPGQLSRACSVCPGQSKGAAGPGQGGGAVSLQQQYCGVCSHLQAPGDSSAALQPCCRSGDERRSVGILLQRRLAIRGLPPLLPACTQQPSRDHCPPGPQTALSHPGGAALVGGDSPGPS